MDRTISKLHNALRIDGRSKTPTSTAIHVKLEDENGYVIFGRGATVPTDAEAGYGKGCIFIKTNGGIASTFYINEGDETSCDFNVGSVGGGDITGLTANLGLIGSAASGNVDLFLGLTVKNTTGGTLTKGTLVRVTSYSSGYLITKADADAGLAATHVLSADIENNASGTVYSVYLVTNIATNAFSVGDPLYLSATAGEFSTAPTGADQIVQKVGIVVTSHATTGSALFYFDTPLLKVGTSNLQPGAVTPAISAQAEAVTVTADGLTTGLISVTARHVTVTSDDATKIATLPASVVGKEITGYVGSNGFRLQTTAASNIKINNVDSDGTGYLVVPANTAFVAKCVSATDWIVTLVSIGGVKGSVAAVTGTDDGLTTGLIPNGTTFVVATSAGATKALTLPAISASTIGQQIDIAVGANGYELLTPDTSGNTINTVDSDGTNQLDVAANTVLRCVQVSATGWFAYQVAATTITVVAPDND